MIDNNPTEKKAIQWLSNEIKQIPNFYKKNDITESFTLNNKKVPPLCEIVLYKYSAIKGNLNGYWDEYPITLIVRPLETHFYGFNLHYLDHDIRKKIVDVLLGIRTRSTSPAMAFKRIYPFIDGLVKVGLYGHAYKNYLYNAMQSKFIIINPTHYNMISNLPIAKLKENRK